MKMAKRNPFESSEWKRFEEHVRTETIPKMRDSATVLLIAPSMDSKFDVQFAVQIGAAVLLEKPLLVIAMIGRPVPPKLERIADRIIYTSGVDDPSTKDEIAKFMNDFGKQ
jgi:hypothetical protein